MGTEVPDFAAAKYVLLTTFRRNGQGVGTPVWSSQVDAELTVWTMRDSGKVKRLGHHGHAEVQVCDATGRNREGPKKLGTARMLDARETERVRAAIARKYGVHGKLAMLLAWLCGGYKKSVGIAIRFEPR